MAFSALDIIRTATTTLFDASHKRWPLAELLDHINEAARAIATVKPNANTQTVVLDLVQGTLQTLPEQYTILSRVTRNMVSTGVGGDAIRMVQGRGLMDSFFPGWQANASLFGPIVKHVTYDDADLRHYYVMPGNDGNGHIEAIVGVMPESLTTSGDPLLEASYESLVVALPDLYRTPVTDYVLYRSFAKDQGIAASAQRAQMHLSSFQTALGITDQAQTSSSAARVPQKGA